MADYLTYYRDKVILVTGGAGAIGSNLCKALSDLRAKMIIILDDLSASYEWNIPSEPNIIFIKGSVTNDISLKRVFNEKQILYSIYGTYVGDKNEQAPNGT